MILILSGCSGGTPFFKQNPQVVASPDKATLMLAQAADKASTALESLAAIEQSQYPAVQVEPVPDAPPELERGITIKWIGPVGPLARRMADEADYRFITLGDEPPVPIVVNIDVQNARVIDVLRNVGLQLGQRADIKVDGRTRVVELQYSPITTGAGG